MHQLKDWKWVAQSCLTLCDTMDLYSPWNSLGQYTGVGSLSLPQGILPTHPGIESRSPALLTILYQLSHKRSSIKRVVFPKEGFPAGSDGKKSACNTGDLGFSPWVGKILWRRKWQPTPVFLPGKSRGQSSLVGYSLWGRKKSDTTERLHLHFHMLAK